MRTTLMLIILLMTPLLCNAQQSTAGSGDVIMPNRNSQPAPMTIPRGMTPSEVREYAKIAARNNITSIVEDYEQVSSLVSKAQRSPAGRVNINMPYRWDSDVDSEGAGSVRIFAGTQINSDEPSLTIDIEAARKHHTDRAYPVSQTFHWTMAGEKTQFIYTMEDATGRNGHLGIYRDNPQTRFNADLELQNGVANGTFAYTDSVGNQVSGEIKNTPIKQLMLPNKGRP